MNEKQKTFARNEIFSVWTQSGHTARHGPGAPTRPEHETLFGTAINDVLRHDLWLERKQLGVRGIDYDSHPMAVRCTKCFHPREVFKRPSSFGADERFVDPKYVTVAMEDNCWFVVALHLFGEGLDVVVMTGWNRRT